MHGVLWFGAGVLASLAKAGSLVVSATDALWADNPVSVGLDATSERLENWAHGRGFVSDIEWTERVELYRSTTAQRLLEEKQDS